LFHLKLNAHYSSDLIFRRTVEPSMNLHHSLGKTATPPQNSFSNHHTVSRVSIGAELETRQVVAQRESRVRRPAFFVRKNISAS
jgi:hypothetical protein